MSADSNSGWASNSVLEPLRADVRWLSWRRAAARRTADAIRDIHKALFAVNPMRHMPEPAGIHALSGARARHFSQERGIAALMSVICVILLSVTGAGIVGLSSLWVGQRTMQIGVRRAMGARKIDILRYFQMENLLIAGGGALVGSLFAFVLSNWLMRHYDSVPLPPLYVVSGRGCHAHSRSGRRVRPGAPCFQRAAIRGGTVGGRGFTVFCLLRCAAVSVRWPPESGRSSH